MLIKQEIIEQIDDDLQVVHHVVAPTPQYVSPSVHIETLNKLVTSLERERDEAKELANRAEEESRRVNAMEAERKRKANEYQKNRNARIKAEKEEAKREEKERSEEDRKRKRREYQRNYNARKRAEKEEERRREEQEQWRGALRSEVTPAQAERDPAAPMEQSAVQEALAVAPGSPLDAPPAREEVQNDYQPTISHSEPVSHLTQTVLNMSVPQSDAQPADLRFGEGPPINLPLQQVQNNFQSSQSQMFNGSTSNQPRMGQFVPQSQFPSAPRPNAHFLNLAAPIRIHHGFNVFRRQPEGLAMMSSGRMNQGASTFQHASWNQSSSFQTPQMSQTQNITYVFNSTQTSQNQLGPMRNMFGTVRPTHFMNTNGY